jgi:hypothetical protein
VACSPHAWLLDTLPVIPRLSPHVLAEIWNPSPMRLGIHPDEVQTCAVLQVSLEGPGYSPYQSQPETLLTSPEADTAIGLVFANFIRENKLTDAPKA